jgi:hypothetical protein
MATTVAAGGSVRCAVAASAEWQRQRSSGAATVGSAAAALAAQGRQRQRSGGIGCGGGSLAVAGSRAAGRRQRRRQSGGSGGSTALALARWQRQRRRQPNHPCHGAADSAINCSRTAWRRSSVPLWTEGRRRIAGGSVTPICHIPVCVCFWPPVTRWGTVMHEIPISSPPSDDIPSIP